jgi:hypothetical protein
MLVMQGGGRVRTQDEHKALFEAAGLQVTRIIAAAAHSQGPSPQLISGS